LLEADPAIQAAWEHPGNSLYGVFNVCGEAGQVRVHLPDGSYPDVLSGAQAQVSGGKLPMPQSAAILRYGEPVPLRKVYCDLLDYTCRSY
jgi:hypothetical protein